MMKALKEWMIKYFRPESLVQPFSFKYGDKFSTEFIKTWKTECISKEIDDYYTQHEIIYTDPKTCLKAHCILTEYKDYPAVEWVLLFENAGDNESLILEEVYPADLAFTSDESGVFKLYHAEGSHSAITDFQPYETKMALGMTKDFSPYGGRSSDGVLPFFNLQKPDGNGTIMAIGWTGQWIASFMQTDDANVKFQAGMELTHLKLYPKEKIRTPSILLLFWDEDFIHGQNQIRRLLLDHYSPKPNGIIVDPPVASSPHKIIGFEDTTADNMIQQIDNIISHNLPIDTYWIDAGWYSCFDSKTGKPNWALGVGNCDVDPIRYPDGMKPVGDAAHKNGLKFLLWFEPERVMIDTWLYKNHPDWLLSPANLPPEQQYQSRDGFYLLNLGNPDALAWLKDKVSEMIGDIGVDIYRNDFNMYPLHYWRNGEEHDRQGINEIRYISGLYDYFDALLHNHPNLVIDNCASGGRRLDFEMLRRSVALWRSDLCWEPVAEQCMTYGLSLWMPIHGVGSISLDPYDFRSGMGTNFSAALDYNDPDIWSTAIELFNQYKSIRHLFEGDFYPLTPYSTSQDVWMAWQFDRSDIGEGMIQAFRREKSVKEYIQIRLKGLDSNANYIVKDIDSVDSMEMTGSELMNKGLDIYAKNCPQALVFTYKVNKL